MSFDTSCPSVLPDGIIRNTTGFRGPQAIDEIYAGTVQERNGATPTEQTMQAMIQCCVNRVYAGEIESAYVLPDADFERHCALWCEWDPANMDDFEKDARPWQNCVQEKTNATVGHWTVGPHNPDKGGGSRPGNETVNEPTPEPAMGASLGSPSMLGLALVSIIVVGIIIG